MTSAMSSGRPRRPSGMFARNFALFSGVSGMPVNAAVSPVVESTGEMQLKRMLCGAYSTAKLLVTVVMADLLWGSQPGSK